MSKSNTSFLPEDYVEKKSQRRTNLISVSLFVVVMSGIIGAFVVTDRQRVEVSKLQQQVNADFEEAAKRLEQLNDLQSRKQAMVRKARITAMLIERLPRSLILADLINHMPTTLSLLELELVTKVVKTRTRRLATSALEKAKQKQQRKNGAGVDALPPMKKTEASLRLVGVAPTDVQVAQFMTALSRSSMFTDVNLAFSEEVKMSEDQLMRKFRIDMKLNNNITAKDIDPKLVQRNLKQDPMSNTIQIDANGQLVIPTDPVSEPGVIQAQDRPQKPSFKKD